MPNQFQYQMVQVPPVISVKAKEWRGNEAAGFLQELANERAAQGWEFLRVDTIGVATTPGCLASLLGAKTVVTEYFVITFRRPI